jgi:2-dehydro-3-deoxygluconokinase
VDLDGVVFRDEGRIGAYYVELAEAPRGVRVVYDRADSCAARMRPQEIPWERILDSRLLHLTGITPALSSSCRAITKAALSRAREAGVSVSFDVNHRRKLWTEDEAARTLEPMMRGAEILFCSARDARLLFSLGGDPDEVAARLQQRTGARRVVVSCGEEGAAARDGSEAFREPGRKVRVLDRLGAGDALAAGVIHGYLGGDFRQGLRYGVALSALALTQSGDAVVTTPEELRSIADRSSEENFR